MCRATCRLDYLVNALEKLSNSFFFFSHELSSRRFSIFWKVYQQEKLLDIMKTSPYENKRWIDFSATLPGLFLQPFKNAQLFLKISEKGFSRIRASVVSMSYSAGS